jgi:Tol biopolymer transport system component
LIGKRIGPYEITAKLGEGGMGEVYRATDTRLKREVAIKVLPAAFTEDKERLARFEREAQLLAQLNHTNIAQIYGIETSGATHALVMELVDGPTLAERLELGPLSLSESLSVALQIAQALEEAHDKGIIHRDLKPQNVKASSEGKAKVLDFGLAKAMDPAAGSASAADLARSPTLMNSPTLTAAHGTQMGVILGTAAYMSPEQAAGKTIDRRTDIWAFGVLLWEMLTGRRLFEAESVAETLGAVFRQPLDLDALPASTPAAVRQLVTRCLERDPKARLRDIGEARIALTAALAAASGTGAAAGGFPGSTTSQSIARTVPQGPSMARWWPWLAAVLATVAAFAIVALTVRTRGSGPRPDAESAATARQIAVAVAPPAGHVLAAGDAPILDLARDGSAVAFEAEGPDGRQLFLRRLDRAEVVPIAGTLGASHPFFSPDGRSLGFFDRGRIRKVALAGGPVSDVTSINANRGATWTDGGWIVYTQTFNTGLLRVREAGGRPEPLTTLDPKGTERSHRWPTAIPGTPWVLFTVGVSNSPNFYDDSRIDAVNLQSGERKPVFDGAWMARFAPPATLLVQRRGALLSLAFDPLAAEVRGEERVVLDNVGGEPSSGAGFFAGGEGGVLAYVPTEALVEETTVVIVEADGTSTRLPLPEKRFWYPRFSPDGRSLILDVGSGQGADDELWRYDLAPQRMSRVSFVAGSAIASWSPDGEWIAYTGGTAGRTGKVFRKRVDGSAGEEVVWDGEDLASASDWTRDGRAIIGTDLRGEMGLYYVPIDGGESRRIVAAPGGQYSAAFDPSGRFLAYSSIETGIDEIFISTYPEGGGKWQISTDGGQMPVWTRDGKSVLYVKGDTLLAVDIETAGAFSSATPRELRRGPYILRTPPFRNYDTGPGGRLALVTRRSDVPAMRQVEVLVGWDRLPASPPRP